MPSLLNTPPINLSMSKLYFLIFCWMLLSENSFSQRPFGHENAIPADSNIFVSWANACEVKRGFQNIADTILGNATIGDANAAIGAAKQNGIVSLGDGGFATLSFPGFIKNNAGPDFAVFENGFNFGNDSTFYLELAFVEVSSDGNHFVRFAAVYDDDTLTQKDFTYGSNPRKTKNLAGNYSFGYGTPFDLEDLKDSVGIDINHISHVRLIDVVGSLSDTFANRDILQNKINDPWPTPFGSSGFDLDAVGVMNLTMGLPYQSQSTSRFYPNPVQMNQEIFITGIHFTKLILSDITGAIKLEQEISPMQPGIGLIGLVKGIYFVRLFSENKTETVKLCIE